MQENTPEEIQKLVGALVGTSTVIDLVNSKQQLSFLRESMKNRKPEEIEKLIDAINESKIGNGLEQRIQALDSMREFIQNKTSDEIKNFISAMIKTISEDNFDYVKNRESVATDKLDSNTVEFEILKMLEWRKQSVLRMLQFLQNATPYIIEKFIDITIRTGIEDGLHQKKQSMKFILECMRNSTPEELEKLMDAINQTNATNQVNYMDNIENAPTEELANGMMETKAALVFELKKINKEVR